MGITVLYEMVEGAGGPINLMNILCSFNAWAKDRKKPMTKTE